MHPTALGRLTTTIVVLASLVAALIVVTAPSVGAADGTFVDDDGSPHEGNIEAVAAAGLTSGCDSSGTRFCPGAPVTRAQMARFLVRATGPGSAGQDYFSDDDGSPFEADINAVAAAGITSGCDATGTVYCPTNVVTRGQMATFLTNAYDLPPAAGGDFRDVGGSPFAADIAAVAAAGITLGCEPDRFCPTQAVTRAQFASFLARAEGLEPLPVGDVPLGEVAFEETFVDQSWEQTMEHGLFHRDDDVVNRTSWVGEHAPTGPDDACTGPDATRTIQRGTRNQDFNDDWIYRCAPGGDPAKGHLMTSIGDTSAYSIGSLTPRVSFEDVVEIRWAVNINSTTLSSRQFPEVKLVPAGDYDDQNIPCMIGWLPCNTDSAADLGVVGMSLQNREPHITTPAGRWNIAASPICNAGSWNGGDPACSTSMIRRTMYFRDNGNGTLTLGIEQPDGRFTQFDAPGAFPDGPVRVVFADHNYTPSKDGASSAFTWHWDDLVVRTD